MSSKYLLGIDIGTQGTKAVLVNLEGEILGTGFQEYSVEQPFPSWAEQWPQVWEEAFYNAVKEAMARAKVSPRNIAGLCLSGLYGGSGVPVDKEMRPLRPCLIWMDRRAIEEVRWIKENVDLEKLFRITGNYVDTYFGYTKILWIQRHEPEIWKRVYKFVPPTSYIEHRLTGKLAIDFSSAGNLGGIFDLHNRRWSEEMAQALAIPLELMPERLIPSTEVVGELLPEPAAKCGLVPGIPVVAGGIDAPMATLSAGAIEPGDNVAMMGTSTCWGVIHRGEGLSPNLVSMPHVVNCYEEIYTWAGAATSGAIVRWFRDNFGQEEKEAAQKLGLDSYQLLDLEAEKVPPGSDGLLVLPYFMGERAPLWDPQARGTIIGLTLYHTKAHIYRAFLEAAAYSLRHSIEAGEECGLQVKKEVRLVGGAAKSQLWPQILADVLGRPVVVLRGNVEAPLADALLAGLATGLIPSHRVIADWIQGKMVFHPRKEWHLRYDQLYKLYRQVFPNISDIMHGLAELQAWHQEL
ncbi:MAG: FGGY-family carbohydrate kinase [Candidatus Bipolaricaulaceae bacterium]